jgi:hypothetical protein
MFRDTYGLIHASHCVALMRFNCVPMQLELDCTQPVPYENRIGEDAIKVA